MHDNADYVKLCPHCNQPLEVTSLDKINSPKARTSDPETSHAAAKINFPRRASHRRRILLSFFQVEDANGLTAWEVHVATGLPLNSVSTRMSELERGGWITTTGQTRKSGHGVNNQIYRLSMAALEAFEIEASLP